MPRPLVSDAHGARQVHAPMDPTRTTSIVAMSMATIVLLLLLAACAPGAEAGDDPPTIGFVRLVPSQDHDAFLRELRDLGWRPGVDVRILPTDIDELYETPQDVRDALSAWDRDGSKPDLVIAYSTPYAQLIQEETDLPGLFVVNDPIAGGLISDLDRPDGQLTGVTWRTPADRTLDLTSRAFGGLDRLGYLAPQDDAGGAAHLDHVAAAADDLGIEVVVASFDDSDGDAARAVAELAEATVDAVYLSSSNATVDALTELEQALDGHGLPTIANVTFVDFAVITLAPDVAELQRQTARQVSRLLSGAEVAAVPAEDPRRFLTIIDETRADAVGRSIDPSVLREADLVR